MSYSDDDLGRELRRELQGNLVPFDPARAQNMIDEAIGGSSVRRLQRSRWTLPVLASGAVAVVVGGAAGAAVALHPDGKPAHPGGGPSVTVRLSTPPTAMPSPPSSAPTTLPSPPSSVPTTSPASPPSVAPTPPSPPSSVPTTSPASPPSVAPTPPPTNVATTSPQAPPSGLTPMPGRG